MRLYPDDKSVGDLDLLIGNTITRKDIMGTVFEGNNNF